MNNNYNPDTKLTQTMGSSHYMQDGGARNVRIKAPKNQPYVAADMTKYGNIQIIQNDT